MTRSIPSYHALRAFEAAARLGSFRRASEELHVTASAISHQIRGLEQHFGRALFVPQSRAKILTDDGARLAAGLGHAFDAIETACADVTPRAAPDTLTVHCAPSFAAKWLAPRLPRFMARHPTIPIRLSSGAGIYDLRRDEATDVAIVYGDPATEPGVAVESLGEEEVNAVCDPAMNAALAAFDRRAMMGMRLVESSVSPIRWSDWFAVNGLGRHPPTPTTGFDRGALVVSAAVQGVGAALESERFTEAELASGQLVLLGGARFRSIRRVLHSLVVRTGSQPHRVRVFRSWLLEEVAAARQSAGSGERMASSNR